MSNLATVGRLRRATSQLPVSWYCDPAVYDAEQRLLLPRAPGYVGHELMVPERRRLLRAGMARQRAGAGAQRRGRRAPVEHLPAPAGDHAEGARQRAQHRLPDPPLDLRPEGRAARRAAFRRQALPEPRPLAARELERPAVRRPTRCPPRPRAPGRLQFRFLGLHARPGRGPRVQLQLEDLHRGLSRGLPRRAVPSGPRAVRDLRRPEVGIRRLVLGADRRRQQPAGQGRNPDLRALAQGGARLLSRRACRRTARSG